MAAKIAVDGPGDQLWRGTTCGVTVPLFDIYCNQSHEQPTLFMSQLIEANSLNYIHKSANF